MKIEDDVLIDISSRDEGVAIIKMVASQVNYPKEGRLIFAVFATAIADAFSDNLSRKDMDSVVLYLKGDMVHLELLGVNVAWVKRLINKTMRFKGQFEVAKCLPQ